MSRRRGNPKAGAAGLGAVAVVVALCCGGLVSCGDDDKPARQGPVQVVEVTTPAAEPTTAEPVQEPTEEPDVDVDDDDDDAPRRGVTPGAFCDTPGAVGFTKKGTRMTCKGPGRERWRR